MNLWKVVLATLAIFGAGVVTGGLLVSYSDRAARPQWRRPLNPDNPRGPMASVYPNNPNNPPNQVNPAGPRENRVPAIMPAPLRKEFLDRLDRELNLNADQRDRIEKIMSDGQERTRQFWQRIEPDVRREMGDVRDRIREELSPDQRQHFEEMMRHPQRRPDNSTN